MRAAGLLVALLMALTACSPAASPEPAPSGPSCLSLPAPSPVPLTSASQGAKAVPDLALRCWPGGGQARLSEIKGPAIINLWASWCGPCKEELPAMQRYASRAGDRIRLVGVITSDKDREAQQSIVDRFSLTFPMLEDPEQMLLSAVGRSALPVTLFVSGDGRVAHLYNAQALDEATIELFAENYLGVVVP